MTTTKEQRKEERRSVVYVEIIWNQRLKDTRAVEPGTAHCRGQQVLTQRRLVQAGTTTEATPTYPAYLSLSLMEANRKSATLTWVVIHTKTVKSNNDYKSKYHSVSVKPNTFPSANKSTHVHKYNIHMWSESIFQQNTTFSCPGWSSAMHICYTHSYCKSKQHQSHKTTTELKQPVLW